jgi:RNA recognition motif-containing protein
MGKKLYVGNLNFDANEDQVKELFSQYGDVQEVRIIMDRFSGRSRGFAFVKMGSEEAAGEAKQALHGFTFLGKSLVIDFARAESGRERTGEPRGDRGEKREKRFDSHDARPPRREGHGRDGQDRRQFDRRDGRSHFADR